MNVPQIEQILERKAIIALPPLSLHKNAQGLDVSWRRRSQLPSGDMIFPGTPID
jgi:hypothetical protein